MVKDLDQSARITTIRAFTKGSEKASRLGGSAQSGLDDNTVHDRLGNDETLEWGPV